ncbi:MAG: lipoyl synthase [Actinobacteria bacterium]|nr:lipoyl synthase [Actinomycetota bacterium]MBU1944084.1 lipoyl synthase [Actinomycetota bacterium]MBU2687262.1 lipoyl synthase [Actinomycetota bacterium]
MEPSVDRMPRWMLRPVRCGTGPVEEVLFEEGLNTVCVGAKCPNRGECFASGTATFMILGARCTRSCGFCAVPNGGTRAPDPDEPHSVARAARRMGLGHVVVTSVTRDDLPDGGASHFASTVSAVRDELPGATVEVLVPDFGGSASAIEVVTGSAPDVFNHNVETVPGLYAKVRPQADYRRSLQVLARAAGAGLAAKSGFMVGLGETMSQVRGLLGDLREAGVSMVTVGQYLRPARENLPVTRYREPSEFEEIEGLARTLGFTAVAAAPLVRSSYGAGEMLKTGRAAG